MIYEFEGYRLDTAKHELVSPAGDPLPLEPQVFALLTLLIEHRERMVGKDEIIDRIWRGRIVSEAAVASRIKSARHAIGDDGRAQRLIRTLHRRGFRFVAEVRALGARRPTEPESAPTVETDAFHRARPSIAVLPFSLVGVAGPSATVADALPHDLIVALSRLRWLFVISRASSFQLRGTDARLSRVRETLNVRYALTGLVEMAGERITVTVELNDAVDENIVWSETYRGKLDAVHEIREAIVHAVVNALELQIPLNEAQRVLRSPQNLDAWSVYHLGLHHMFQFTRGGAARAGACFRDAIGKEPGFARAYAGLSFAHFEDAFLRFAEDKRDAVASARRNAELALEHDPLDPFCNLVMGRASWLEGDLEAGLPWLDRAVELNPNYAQAKYSSAWTRTLLGEGAQGQGLVDDALDLSPLDPLRYGMLGVRSFSHMVLDEPEEAARWGEKAARAPRAHPFIELIAAVAHDLNGDQARARQWAQSALVRQPGLGAEDFMRTFPFRDVPARGRVAEALRRLGL
ncbi:MAG TPA: winged helix-turn-helix domain-containing protein [Caulobacteraceae bacterium]|jgi:TolB-like protein|nr:winged helix-turn-helix domain-containing protein [Caulobacteraceae bacterium]